MTYLISVGIVVVLAALAAAGFYMVKSGGNDSAEQRSKGMVRALTVRIGVSVLLFLCILLAWSLGWITPTGLPAGK